MCIDMVAVHCGSSRLAVECGKLYIFMSGFKTTILNQERF